MRRVETWQLRRLTSPRHSAPVEGPLYLAPSRPGRVAWCGARVSNRSNGAMRWPARAHLRSGRSACPTSIADGLRSSALHEVGPDRIAGADGGERTFDPLGGVSTGRSRASRSPTDRRPVAAPRRARSVRRPPRGPDPSLRARSGAVDASSRPPRRRRSVSSRSPAR